MIDGDESGNHEHHSISHPVSHRCWSLRLAPERQIFYCFLLLLRSMCSVQGSIQVNSNNMSILCHIHAIRKQKAEALWLVMARLSGSHSSARPGKIAWNGKLYQAESGHKAVPCRHINQEREQKERERERWSTGHVGYEDKSWFFFFLFLVLPSIILCLLYGPMGGRRWYKAQRMGSTSAEYVTE